MQYATSFEINIKNSKFNHNNAQKGSSVYSTTKLAKIENTSFNNDPSSYESEIYSNTAAQLNNVSFNNVTKEDIVEYETPENTTQPNQTNPNSNVPKPIIKKKTVIIAKSRIFKLKAKVKTYTIILKSGKSLLKYKKIILKVNRKTYIRKTNSRGICVFNLKFVKKATCKALIQFNGDKYYKYSRRIVIIRIK